MPLACNRLSLTTCTQCIRVFMKGPTFASLIKVNVLFFSVFRTFLQTALFCCFSLFIDSNKRISAMQDVVVYECAVFCYCEIHLAKE